MEDALTDSTYLILLALLRPQHGYGIMKEIKERTQEQVQIGPASMYTILKKLQKEKLIELTEDVDRKKVYVITSQGIEALEKDVHRRKLFFQIGEEMLKEADHDY